MKVRLLYPHQGEIELAELGDWLASSRTVEPFHNSIISAAVDLSRRVFQDPQARQHPELLSLAFWMRGAEILQLAERFRALETSSRILVPRGLVFHLPPRNVDTMFVYSWLLSALCGNRNVIRLSPQLSESGNLLLKLLCDALAEAEAPVNTNTVIVSYGHEEEPTAALSASCDVRVIWGGDQTVATIRKAPLAPHAKELAFFDRYALSAIAVQPYLALGDEEREALANQFFNDCYWFDQMACSSPRLVVWVGDRSQACTASQDFFTRVAAAGKRHSYRLPPAANMNKLLFSCSSILDSPVVSCQRHPGVTVLTLDSLEGFKRDHPGGGLFWEASIEHLHEIATVLERRDQTLTWFGFAPDQLRSLARKLNGRAIDRIVPIGQALQFHRFWDGYDLLQEFCRGVHIESEYPRLR